jgi:hypothetical protein
MEETRPRKHGLRTPVRWFLAEREAKAALERSLGQVAVAVFTQASPRQKFRARVEVDSRKASARPANSRRMEGRFGGETTGFLVWTKIRWVQ